MLLRHRGKIVKELVITEAHNWTGTTFEVKKFKKERMFEITKHDNHGGLCSWMNISMREKNWNSILLKIK